MTTPYILCQVHPHLEWGGNKAQRS